MSERWVPIAGYEGRYAVSDQGRVISLARSFTRGRQTIHVPDLILKASPSGRGDYLLVKLSANNKKTTRTVHSLVAEAFLGPRTVGMECCHNNGDGHDNRLANLRWGTPKSNGEDIIRHGTHFQARKTHCKWGHEFTPENTYHWVSPKGQASRICRTCRALRSA